VIFLINRFTLKDQWFDSHRLTKSNTESRWLCARRFKLSHQYLYSFFCFFSLSPASWSAVDCERRFKLLEHDVYNVLHRWVLSQTAVFWLQGKHQQHFCERTFSDCEFEMWNRLDDFFKMLLILLGNVIHIHMYDFSTFMCIG
jgi:hypothetical protein